MRPCILILTAVLGAALCAPARADNRGGSGYSRYGLGDILPVYNIRSLAMGGAGLSLAGASDIDVTNPAGLSHITRAMLAIDGTYEGFSATDDRTSAYLSRTSFGGASLALPIAPSRGVTFAMGLVPVSRVNYNIVSPDTLGGVSYSLQHLGEGGISRAQFSLSAAPVTDLHLGIRLNYHFGTIDHTIRQTFSSADYTSSEVVRSTRHSGIGLTFGSVYGGLGRLLGLDEHTSLSLGVVVSTPSWMTTSTDRYFSYNTGNLVTRDTASLPDGKLKMPYAYAFGLACQAEQWSVAADYAHQNWSDLTSDGVPAPNVRNSDRISAGGEYVPKRDPSAPWTQRWAYRFGFFRDASYYRFGATDINETGITAGVGIPITGDSRLNVAASYSFRGTTDNGLQQDRIFRLSFGFTAGELWFVRREEE